MSWNPTGAEVISKLEECVAEEAYKFVSDTCFYFLSNTVLQGFLSTHENTVPCKVKRQL